MATVKCKHCKKQIDKDIAYKVEHTTKSGKKQNHYYCSFEEYNKIETEKEFFRKCQYTTDDMLGYPICNNSRNKFLANLNKLYSYETIYNCIEFYKYDTLKYMEKKCIESEYGKLRYIFSVIENNIKDFSESQQSARETRSVIADVEIEQPVEIEPTVEVETESKPSIHRRKSLKDRMRK